MDQTVISCKVPPIIANSNVTYSGVWIGSVATYKCFPGYQFSTGGNIRSTICLGAAGWSNTRMFCIGMAIFYRSNNLMCSKMHRIFSLYNKFIFSSQLSYEYGCFVASRGVFCRLLSSGQPVCKWKDKPSITMFSTRSYSGHNRMQRYTCITVSGIFNTFNDEQFSFSN